MRRILDCDFKEGGCDDPHCKRGLCVLERDERERSRARAGAEAREFDEEKVAFILAAFEAQRREKPTDAQIRRLLNHPKVVAAAQQRIAGQRELSKIVVKL